MSWPRSAKLIDSLLGPRSNYPLRPAGATWFHLHHVPSLAGLAKQSRWKMTNSNAALRVLQLAESLQIECSAIAAFVIGDSNGIGLESAKFLHASLKRVLDILRQQDVQRIITEDRSRHVIKIGESSQAISLSSPFGLFPALAEHLQSHIGRLLAEVAIKGLTAYSPQETRQFSKFADDFEDVIRFLGRTVPEVRDVLEARAWQKLNSNKSNAPGVKASNRQTDSADVDL